jgi:hypothetical protein
MNTVAAFIEGVRIAWHEARAMELRPLDFGAIFGRAVALYVRYFAPLAAIVAVAIVPVAVVQYLTFLHEQPTLDATLEVLVHPERLRTERVPTLFDSPGNLAILIACALFGYYMLAFSVGGVAAAVARAYRDESVTLRACYEGVLARWSSVVVIVGVAILALVAAYLAAILIVAIPVFAIAAFSARSLPSALPFAVAATIVAVLFALLVIVIVTACAIDTGVVEDRGAAISLRLTFGRIFNRSEFGRALLCGFAVVSTTSLFFAIADSLIYAALSRSPAASVALDTLARILVLPFPAVVLALYYFDARVRYEGFDLERTLAQHGEEPAYAPTAYLSGEERALIKRFLERRDSLTEQRRNEIAAQLAAPVRERVPPELQRLDDEMLLERL